MRIRPRALIGCAAALVGVVLLATAWALTLEPPPLASCRLAGGSILRLEGVTRGPVHHVEVGPYWRRLIARLPLPALRQFAGDPIQDIRGTTSNSVVFWTSVDETSRP